MTRKVRLSDLPPCKVHKGYRLGACACSHGGALGGSVCERCGVHEVHWTSPQNVCEACHDLARAASVARARRRLKFGAGS